MRNLVESILNKDYTKANDHLHEELKIIVARKLLEAKKMFAARVYTEQVTVTDQGRAVTPVGTEPHSYYVNRKGLAEEDKEEKPTKKLSPRAERFVRALTGEKQLKPVVVKVVKND